MADPTLAAWNNVTPVYLGNPAYKQNDVTYRAEPSGLTIYRDGGALWIFVVSDNGILARAQLPATGAPDAKLDWQINPTPDASDKAYDYESCTFAKGNLMIGIEGDRDGSAPQVQRFDQADTGKNHQAGAFTSSAWTLDGIAFGGQTNSGMEGMTLVPWNCYPPGWTGNTEPHYQGVFFVAVQADAGQIYAYDLAQGGDGGAGTAPIDFGDQVTTLLVPDLASAAPGDTPLISDLFFDAGGGALYVMYDGGTDAAGGKLANDYLQKLTVSTSNDATAADALAASWDYQLPWLNCEGVAVVGDDLYVCIDDGGSPGNNGVFVLPGALASLPPTDAT